MNIGQQNKNVVQEIQIIIFRLRDEEFGVDILNVREITKIMDITMINEPTGFIKGVSNLRGQIITVVDLAKQFGFSAQEVFPKTARIVVVESKDRTVGLIVDEVLEVFNIPLDQIDPVLKVIQSAVKKDYIKGVGRLGERPITLVDLEKVVHPS